MSDSWFDYNWGNGVGWILIVVWMAIVMGGCSEDTTQDPPRTDSSQVSVAADTMTINRVLRTDDRFSTLVTAVDSTGLDSILSAPGPYTLLAPPNEAFDALPNGTLEILLAEEVDRLRALLLHHVLEGEVDADDLAGEDRLVTLARDSLQVESTDSTLVIGTAQVVDADVEVSNGRIHVIDRVLRPPASIPEDEGGN